MNHATHCKFCKIPITLEIADNYSPEFDPHKLIPMAACNSCADARVQRHAIEGKIGRVCAHYQMLSVTQRTEKRESTAMALTKLTQDYATMISKWHKMQGRCWHEDCVQLLLDKPDKWTIILHTLWELFMDWKKERTPVA